MRKFICLLLCVVLCGCFVSCSKEPEEVTLSNENLMEYVFIELAFGEVDVADNESLTHDEKYYLTCLATITIKPKRDYDFTDTSVYCVLDDGGRWTPVKKASVSRKLTAEAFIDGWHGNIQLDKDGYGETTVFLYCYSDTYDKMHPMFEEWGCYTLGASGTVSKN